VIGVGEKKSEPTPNSQRFMIVSKRLVLPKKRVNFLAGKKNLVVSDGEFRGR